MAHPGSAHGGGEAPGDQSSLRQGAETGSSGDPETSMRLCCVCWDPIDYEIMFSL